MKCKSCGCEIYGGAFEVVSNHVVDTVNGIYHKLPQECIAALTGKVFKLEQELMISRTKEEFPETKKYIQGEVVLRDTFQVELTDLLQAFKEAKFAMMSVLGNEHTIDWREKWDK